MFKDLFSNRLFIGALAFFVLSVGGGLLYMWHVQRQGAEELADTQERVRRWNERQNQQPTTEAPVVEKPPQDGHFHADGTWHESPHEAPVEPPSTDAGETLAPVATPTGPLTYHAALLASHPVEALRAQAAERGHWSEKWIPPFPSDDHEAAALARYSYLTVYYRSTGEIDMPKTSQFREEHYSLLMSMEGSGPRHSDLLKLTWATLDAGDIPDPYYAPSNFPLPGMTYIAPLGIYQRIDIGLLK